MKRGREKGGKRGKREGERGKREGRGTGGVKREPGERRETRTGTGRKQRKRKGWGRESSLENPGDIDRG